MAETVLTEESRSLLDEPLWDEDEFAARIKTSARTVQRWRQTGEGPPYIKLGPERTSPVRYVPRLVRDWLAAKAQSA